FYLLFFFFSSRRRHTRFSRDWSSDVCSSDLQARGCDRERRRYRQRLAEHHPHLVSSVTLIGRRICAPGGAIFAPLPIVATKKTEIGRASCRERVEDRVGAVAGKEKKRSVIRN